MYIENPNKLFKIMNNKSNNNKSNNNKSNNNKSNNNNKSSKSLFINFLKNMC